MDARLTDRRVDVLTEQRMCGYAELRITDLQIHGLTDFPMLDELHILLIVHMFHILCILFILHIVCILGFPMVLLVSVAIKRSNISLSAIRVSRELDPTWIRRE